MRCAASSARDGAIQPPAATRRSAPRAASANASSDARSSRRSSGRPSRRARPSSRVDPGLDRRQIAEERVRQRVGVRQPQGDQPVELRRGAVPHEPRIAPGLGVFERVVAGMVRAERTVEAELGDRRPERVGERDFVGTAARLAHVDAAAAARTSARTAMAVGFSGSGTSCAAPATSAPSAPLATAPNARSGHVLVGVQVGDGAAPQLVGVLAHVVGGAAQPDLFAVPQSDDDRAPRASSAAREVAEPARRFEQHRCSGAVVADAVHPRVAVRRQHDLLR